MGFRVNGGKHICFFSKKKDGKQRFFTTSASLGGGEKMWEGISMFVDHRPFPYLFFGTSNTYFGNRVAFVLCSI